MTTTITVRTVRSVKLLEHVEMLMSLFSSGYDEMHMQATTQAQCDVHEKQ